MAEQLTKQSPILVVGAGSIGERHIGVLQRAGYERIVVLRTRQLPLRTLNGEGLEVVTTFGEASKLGVKAAIICTPTALHLEQTIACLEIGCHVLAEKPLHHLTADLQPLANVAAHHQRLVQVAYMLRYHPYMQRVKQLVVDETFGKLVSMHTYWGEYLPDWHPWEDYREGYAARAELGGGAALTLSHDLDLACWLAQSPIQVNTRVDNRNSALEVDVPSASEIGIRFESGLTAHATLSFHDRVPRRHYRFCFEQASLEINYLKHQLEVFHPDSEKQETLVLGNFDRNQMFDDQWAHFVQQANTPFEQRLHYTKRYIDESETILRLCLG